MTDSMDVWCADARASLQRLQSHACTVDFADVMRRANALDAEEVTAAQFEDVDSLAPVVQLRPATTSEGGGDLGLSGFVQDAVASLERTVEERRLAPVGPAPAPEPQRSRVAGWLAAGSLLAAAAAAVLFLDVPGLVGARVEDRADPEQALLIEEEAPSGGDVVEARPTPRPATPVPQTVLQPPEPAQSSAPVAVARPVRRTSLSDLATRAERQWRARDLGSAVRTLNLIVRRGGTTRQAEMAYADLISIAAQQGDAGGRRRLWRRYLKKFPRGRFADDAAAGLCRAAGTADTPVCWAGYLVRFPRGSYRAEARRAGAVKTDAP